MNIKKYLPKVDNEIIHNKQFKTKMEAWIEAKEEELENGGGTTQKFIKEDLEFQLNKINAEIRLLTKTYTEDKLRQFEDTW